MSASLAVPPGNPEALRQLAAELRSTAQASGDLGGYTSQLTSAIVSDGEWSGSGSEAFGAQSSSHRWSADAPCMRRCSASRSVSLVNMPTSMYRN
jgi:hypothetical protein